MTTGEATTDGTSRQIHPGAASFNLWETNHGQRCEKNIERRVCVCNAGKSQFPASVSADTTLTSIGTLDGGIVAGRLLNSLKKSGIGLCEIGSAGKTTVNAYHVAPISIKTWTVAA